MHFFVDITNIFVNMTDFSCHLKQKDALPIPDECLCVIMTNYFLLCNACSHMKESYTAIPEISNKIIPEKFPISTSVHKEKLT